KPPSRHKLVEVHQESGRKTLYIAAHASHIVDWPVEEGRKLLQELMEFATQPLFVGSVAWHRPGDLVIGDHRCTMHPATPFEGRLHRRASRHTPVSAPPA